MITATMKLKLLSLASKHGVEIEHFSPGNVVISIATWQQYESKFLRLIEELKDDPNVRSITADKGFVNIQYDPNALDDRSVIHNWLRIFEKYSF